MHLLDAANAANVGFSRCTNSDAANAANSDFSAARFGFSAAHSGFSCCSSAAHKSPALLASLKVSPVRFVM